MDIKKIKNDSELTVEIDGVYKDNIRFREYLTEKQEIYKGGSIH